MVAALEEFAIDAGGVPKVFGCDFETCFIRGKAF